MRTDVLEDDLIGLECVQLTGVGWPGEYFGLLGSGVG
jgi:hypothetical protein